MTNAEFFAKTARAKGQRVSPVDLNPVTGKVKTGFDGIDGGSRASRSSNGGMTVASPGHPSQKKILGVDKTQAEQEAFARDHKDDGWWKQALTARQNDKNPNIGKMTPDQYKAEMEQKTPLGAIATKPAGPISVAGGGQDRGRGTASVVRYDPNAPPLPKPIGTPVPVAPVAPVYPVRVPVPTPAGVDPVFRAPTKAEEKIPVAPTVKPVVAPVVPTPPPAPGPIPLTAETMPKDDVPPPPVAATPSPFDDLQRRANAFQGAARTLNVGPSGAPTKLAPDTTYTIGSPFRPTSAPDLGRDSKMSGAKIGYTPSVDVSQVPGAQKDASVMTNQAVIDNPPRRTRSSMDTSYPMLADDKKKKDDDDDEEDFA